MKPLLAHTVTDFEAIRFPVLASPKLDGVRCIVRNGVAMTRSLKPIPNLHARKILAALPDLDGELICGHPTAPGVFATSQSAVMTIEGQPDVALWAFDIPGGVDPFADRLAAVSRIAAREPFGIVRLVQHVKICSTTELAEYESDVVAAGYEGVMIRDPQGEYKFGRSTEKQGILGKIKRFEDAEAEILSVAELQRNENAAETNALGHTERSTAAAGLVAGGTLGALIVRAAGWSESFGIGTGFTAAQRAELWADRDSLIGQTVKFKFQPSGAQDAPRFPVFLGFRHPDDLS